MTATTVWVRGKVGYRTRKAVSIVALDRYSRERHHVIQKAQLSEESWNPDGSIDFRVPAEWAFKAKLVPLVADLVRPPDPELGPRGERVMEGTPWLNKETS